MKRLIICVLLLSISVGLCFISNNYLRQKTNELDTYLSECSRFINEEDYVKAEERIKNSKAFWQNNKSRFKIIIEGSFCETVENSLDTLNFCFEEKEYTEAKNSINECRNTLRQILEGERLSFEVIL